jgi:hypothetical protein
MTDIKLRNWIRDREILAQAALEAFCPPHEIKSDPKPALIELLVGLRHWAAERDFDLSHIDVEVRLRFDRERAEMEDAA